MSRLVSDSSDRFPLMSPMPLGPRPSDSESRTLTSEFRIERFELIIRNEIREMQNLCTNMLITPMMTSYVAKHI